mmetsp:Transcript_6192/g.13484  ORF Transcript_6192/g.13484 Transcript_6192/m.13484 type:complete len:191 (-) Transcript_6192:1011-1583(-)|eukprot:CAMPEP_0202898352 /NCGR_PEP_ID=MMETSP1392-20130828/6899_1 /ASSEMBLY_ACC=CAM_ASM_000868 /TAXON_ID=225041 /ORGANISM="Chlamydomonas chlamydogama, Strain SAG 11-48b" /LENGTH=190 /DNA_ID=CAMNT_0049584255 /DNA_START=75 /DNA_END=647 /DNA_ORIENTATION=-
MGGSRRRLKQGKPKAKVGMAIHKRKKIEKTIVPLEIAEQRPDIQKRLKQRVDWEEERNLTDNYQRNGLVLDPNHGFGRNKSSVPLKSKEEREAQGEETFSDDDELRAGCNLERKSGKALPPRLTSHQRQIIGKLIEEHGEDVEAMVFDTKHNKMQHSAGQLRKLITAYHYWRPEDKHDFRAPQKPPKKLF